MPELPEVETTVRGLERVLKGRRIERVEARRADLRRAFPAGSRPAADRRASDGPRPPRQIWADPHRPRRHHDLPPRHVRQLADRPCRARQARSFADRNRRGEAARAQRSAAVRLASTWCRPTNSTIGRRSRRSGPSRSTSTARAPPAAACAGRTAAIKLLLLDQRIVAGLGNIYVCEALYRAGIHPKRAGGIGSLERLKRLVAGDPARCWTKRSRPADRRLRDFASPDGELGYFSKTFAVYDREGQPCGCGGTVRRIVQGGRSTFYCPRCQRLRLRLTFSASLE